MSQDDSQLADQQAVEPFPPAPFPDPVASDLEGGDLEGGDLERRASAAELAAFDAPDARSTQVIQLLARVPVPAMPQDVTLRLFAALAAEAADRANGSGWWTGRDTAELDVEPLLPPVVSAADVGVADVADTPTVAEVTVTQVPVAQVPGAEVVDLAQVRARRATRLPRLLQVAAAIAVLFVGGAVVSQVIGSNGGNATSSSLDSALPGAGQPQVASAGADRPNFSAGTSSPAAGNVPPLDATAKSSRSVPAAQNSGASVSGSALVPSGVVDSPPGTLIETSGHEYSSVTPLAEQVNSLVSAWRSSQRGARSTAVSGVGDAPALSPAAVAAGLEDLAVDQARITACATALSNGASNSPLAIDLGTYNGTPAAVYLLPSSADTLIAWVVGIGCGSGGNEDVLASVTVPR